MILYFVKQHGRLKTSLSRPKKLNKIISGFDTEITFSKRKNMKTKRICIFFNLRLYVKVACAVFLLGCFACLKESTFETRKNVFYFTSKAFLSVHFRSLHNQILTFQIFKCHDVIKCLSMKHETHSTE